MEIFGMVIPLWVIITTYLTGMVIIGYPMGHYSLKVWKYPLGYKLTRKVLFPIASQDSKIISIDDASDFAGAFRLNKALRDNDRLTLMRYVFSTMLLWPVRFSYLFSVVFCAIVWKMCFLCLTKIIYPFLIFVGWVANVVTTLGARGLLVCKKCSQI